MKSMLLRMPAFSAFLVLVALTGCGGGGSGGSDGETPAAAVTANAGLDQNQVSGTTIILDGSGSRASDGSPLTYAWTQTGGYAVSLQPSSTVVSPQFIPPVLPVDETLTFELRVSNGSLSSLDTVVINLAAAATGPYDVMADAGPDQVSTEGDSVTLSASASTNPYSSPLTYQWTYIGDNDTGNRYGPEPVIDDPTAENITFLAPGVFTHDFDREMHFELTVSNGVQNHTDEVRVTVWPVDNIPPTVEDVYPTNGALGGYRDSATGEWIVRVGLDDTISVRFSERMDPASFTSASFYLVEESTGNTIPSTITATNVNRTFVLATNDLLTQDTFFRIHYTGDITDRSGNPVAGGSWLFRSIWDNWPTADVASRQQFVNYGDTVTLDGSASTDSEQSPDTLIYAWSGPAGITINNADQPIASFTAPSYVSGGEFVLTVTDRSGNSDTDSTFVLVMEDTANAVFVHSSLGNDANPGTWNAPVQTLQEALTLAGQGASASDIYLFGSFNLPASISLPDGVSIHGGLRAQTVWNNPGQIEGWIVDGTTLIRVAAPTGIIAQDITLPTTISRLDLDVQSGAAGITNPGGDSIGILARNSVTGMLIIRDNDISAGRGGDGANGSQPAQTASGSDGSDGEDGGNSNIGAIGNPGSGGAGGCGSGFASRGGNGGEGGYGNNNGAGGGDGRRADETFSTNGGQRGLIIDGVATNGGSGGTDAVQGGLGGGGGSFGVLDGTGFFVAQRGFFGEYGEHGTGGGGGGGGAGGPFDVDNLVADTGGGGGGGGGGGCAGAGGTGGYGGGGSYAIYLIDASPIIEGNQLTTVGGGNGGNGGSGGQSGSGGLRGFGGNNGGEIGGSGGNGGDGSAGGAGGGGGGGSGGHSYSIFAATLSTGANPEIRGGNSYTVGPGGAGGAGGAGGVPGERGNVWPEVQSGQPGNEGSDGYSGTVGFAP